MHRRLQRAAVVVTIVAAGVAAGAQRGELDQELRRIFASNDYAPQTFGPAVWFDAGGSYGVVERRTTCGCWWPTMPRPAAATCWPTPRC